MVLFKYIHLYFKKATNQKKGKISFTLRNSKIKTEIIYSSTITHIYIGQDNKGYLYIVIDIQQLNMLA